MISPHFHPASIRGECEPRSRWGFGLTARSIAFLIAGFAFLIPGLWDARLSYGMLAWDGLVLIAALLDGLRLPKPANLIASRGWSNAPSLDSQTEIELVVENQGTVIIECFLIDDLPPALREEEQSGPIRVTAFPRVPASIRYRVEPQQRGDCTTGALYIRYRSPLGLAERWAKAPLDQTVRVYPALHTGEEQQIFLARSRQIDLQLRQTRQRGLGRDFESLRDYREGDDLRDICWTASARRGNLITRQYQTERSQPVWIVLDCGRLMRSRVVAAPRGDAALALPPGSLRAHSKLDHACTAAVALAQLALFSGDRVGLLAYGQTIQQRLPIPGTSSVKHLEENVMGATIKLTQEEFDSINNAK